MSYYDIYKIEEHENFTEGLGGQAFLLDDEQLNLWTKVWKVVFDYGYDVIVSRIDHSIIDMDGIFDVDKKMIRAIEQKLDIKIKTPDWWEE